MSNILGPLDRKITLESKQITPDPVYGSDVVTWIPFASRLWASVQDVLPSRSEQIKQGLAVASQAARVRLRYRAGITPDMRVIVHGATDRICQIIGGPAELGRREGIELVIETYTTQ